MERPAPIAVEDFFCQFIRSVGGYLLTDLANVPDNTWNADFVFPDEDIIIELKTFQKDVFGDSEDVPRILNLLNNWAQRGWIEEGDKVKYALGVKKLPQNCWAEMVDKVLKTIERAIHHANKQLTSSRVLLKMPNSRCVIFLVNDGNYFFNNQQMLAAICQVWERKFEKSEIDCIVYLTLNQVSNRQNSNLDWLVWSPVYSLNKDTALCSFVNKLGGNFIDFLAEFTEIPTSSHEEIADIDEAREVISSMRYLPKELIFKKK